MDDRLKVRLKVAAIIAVIAFAILSDSQRRSQKPPDISVENVGRQVGIHRRVEEIKVGNRICPLNQKSTSLSRSMRT